MTGRSDEAEQWGQNDDECHSEKSSSPIRDLHPPCQSMLPSSLCLRLTQAQCLMPSAQCLLPNCKCLKFPTFLLRTPKFCDFCAAALTHRQSIICAYAHNFSARAYSSDLSPSLLLLTAPRLASHRPMRLRKTRRRGKCSTNRCKLLPGFRMRPIPRSMRAMRILCA